VSVATNIATLEYDSEVVTAAKLIDEIESVGFGAEILNETKLKSSGLVKVNYY
jgi:copper chaperone CopZ